MTVKNILSRIEYTVIIDGVEKPGNILYSTWNTNILRQSEKVSGYKPETMFDPVARDNYQKYITIAYYAGLIPAKVIETRTNEVVDGCYTFTVETMGNLDPENDNTDNQPDAPAKFADMYKLIPIDKQKSFHGKAVVKTYQDGSTILFSYNTPIIKRTLNGDLTRLYAGWSMTIGKHVKAFCGLDKAEFMTLPCDTTPVEKTDKKPTSFDEATKMYIDYFGVRPMLDDIASVYDIYRQRWREFDSFKEFLKYTIDIERK